jgi:hypothetical protein
MATHQTRDEARTCFPAAANPLRAIAIHMTAHVPAAGGERFGAVGPPALEGKNSRREEFGPSAMKSRPSLGADFTVYS